MENDCGEESDSIDTISQKTWAVENNFSQYFKLPEGFLPTTRTIHSLKTGIYDVSWDVSRDNLLFIPQELNIDRLIEFEDSLSVRILKEIELFWTKKELYKKSGLHYKRGILLYGTPGTGKTATINLLIKKMLDRNGIVLTNNVSIHLFITMLKRLRSIEPNRSILVVFEDFDKIVENSSGPDSSVSSYLQLLDGGNQIDNVVFLATTNSPESLEKHFTNRPSRFDLVLKIPLINKNQRETYFKSFNLLNELEIKNWAEDTEGLTISHLKELIISVKLLNLGYQETLKRLKEMNIQPKQSNVAQIGINV